MRTLATYTVFGMGPITVKAFHWRARYDVLVPMLIAMAVYWDTSYLRWVTVEVKWWSDDTAQLWLFYVVTLQLNQGILTARAWNKLREVLLDISLCICTFLCTCFSWFELIFTVITSSQLSLYLPTGRVIVWVQLAEATPRRSLGYRNCCCGAMSLHDRNPLHLHVVGSRRPTSPRILLGIYDSRCPLGECLAFSQGKCDLDLLV